MSEVVIQVYEECTYQDDKLIHLLEQYDKCMINTIDHRPIDKVIQLCKAAGEEKVQKKTQIKERRKKNLPDLCRGSRNSCCLS
jgi:hypothetical protein